MTSERRRNAVLAAVATAAVAWGYYYHQTDLFTSINTTNWYVNGTVQASSIGLLGIGAVGGAVISAVPVPYIAMPPAPARTATSLTLLAGLTHDTYGAARLSFP